MIYAQNVKFEHINRDNGLPINSITAIAQDKDGFVWMGSMYGMVKYDGNNFTSFSYDYNDSATIPGYLVTQILRGPDDYLYLTLSESGITRLNTETEEFKTFLTTNTKNLSTNYVNSIAFNNEGNIWMATSNGIHLFNTKTDEFVRLPISNIFLDNEKDLNHKNYFSAVVVDQNENLFLLGYNSTLLHYNVKTKELSKINYSSEIHESIFLFNSGLLFIDSKNQLWIGTENNGVFVLDLETNTVVNRYLPDVIVSVITEIEGNVWIGTDGQGVVKINSEGFEVDRFVHNPLVHSSISSNAIYSIAQTSDHTIWIGAYATGVNLYNAARHKFSTFTQTGKQNKRLSNKTVLCVEPLNHNMLLIGTDGGGINILDKETQEITHLKSNNNTLDNIVAKTICINNDNSFYLGTFSKGLFYCEFLSNNKVKAIPIERENKGKYKHVWSLFKDSDTSLWVGYLHAGISLYNSKKQKFNDIDFFDNHNIHCIERIDDRIWVSSEQKGMSRCNSKGEVVSWYENDGFDHESLSSNFVLEMFKDYKNRVWIGTNVTGLSQMYDVKQGKFKNYNINNVFPATMVTNIEEDGNGFLWISTNIGIIRFNPETLHSELFDIKDGLNGKQFNINSSDNHNNECLYFGGVDGLSYFNPDKIKSFDVAPQVGLTNLFIEGQKVAVGDTIDGMVILDKPLTYTKKITLSHKHEDFTIGFSALHFESSERNNYKYMLEGFNKTWVESKPGQLSARYTNMKKGEFVFKVMAANPDNLWSETPKELRIKIIPPFYKTTLFYWLVGLFLILLIAAYTRWKTFKLKADREKLKELVKLRTQALEEKTRKVVEQNIEISQINNQLKEYNVTRDKIFSIIAHDLRSPLNAIISFSKILNQGIYELPENKVQKYTSVISQTSVKMNDLITNLLFWVNNQDGKIKTVPENIVIREIFTDLEQFTKANAIEKELTIDFIDNDSNVYADKEMFVTILRNLLSNSIKFTPKRGVISLITNNLEGKTVIKISDSGVGMTPKQIEELEKRETLMSTKGTENESGTGLGLYLCKDFTEKNNGVFLIESEINKGTTITLTFPSAGKI